MHRLPFNCFLSVIFTFTSLSFAGERWISFPLGFRWCVATSAHQIEGNNSASDWWDWETQKGHIKNDDRSGAACDHWNRVDEDISLMNELGINTYRFSVEWAKIEPIEGYYDLNAIQHYRDELKALHHHKIKPIITLHHFTFPRWVRQKGGWEWGGIADAFTKYSTLVYNEIAPNEVDWITINEPMVHISAGYLSGIAPPGEKRDYKDLVPPIRGMLFAHAKVYHALHELARWRAAYIRIGIAHNLRTMDPENPFNPMDILGASVADAAWNWTIPDALQTGKLYLKIPGYVSVEETIPGLKNTQDFIGMNYYGGDLITFSPGTGIVPKTRQNLPKNDMGWDIYPEGFYRVLHEVYDRYHDKPILITENGIADHADSMRPQFIKDHLYYLAKAINDGVPVESYCHWSLLDNFEWADGFSPRFGLYEMDYKTQKRSPRGSVQLLRGIIKNNGFLYKED